MVFPRAEFNLKSENGADEGDAPSENPGSHNPSPEIPRMSHILPFIKHTFTDLFLFLTMNLFCSLALKNCADRKFSYLQLPVSLKLLYTVLQVNVSLGSVGLLRRHVTNESALTLLVGDE